MAEGAITAWERDRAQRQVQALAAEIRIHEQNTRLDLTSSRRPADERLYRRLRQINDGRSDADETYVPLTAYPPELLPYS